MATAPLLWAGGALLWAAGGAPEWGDPFLKVYHSRDYGAFFQNWSLVQAADGLIYVGNNSGVLEYDGARWRLIPTDQRRLVAALAMDRTGRVCVGGVGEIGFLERGASGAMQFRSLLPAVPSGDRAFTDVHAVVPLATEVAYVATERLLVWDGRSVRARRPQGLFHGAWEAGGRLVVNDSARGLAIWDGHDLVPLPGGEAFREEELAGVLADGPERLLVVTGTRGIFHLEGGRARPWRTAADEFLMGMVATHALRLKDGSLALGTRRGGLVRLDGAGKSLGWVGLAQGLPSANVRSLMQDVQGGVWMALGKGLARVELASPLSRFGEQRGLRGAAYHSLRHQGTLMVGTDQGLFRLGPDQRFEGVPGLQGGIWQLERLGDRLLVGGQDGLYALEGGRLRRLWTSATPVVRMAYLTRSDRWLVCTRNAVHVFRVQEGRWEDEGPVPGVRSQVRTILEEPDGRVWLGTSGHGVVRLGQEGGRPVLVRRYGVEDGLPSLSHTYVHRVGGELRVATHAGIHRLQGDRFEPDPQYAGLFPEGPRWCYALHEDGQGRLWMHTLDEARRIQSTGHASKGPDGRMRWVDETTVRMSEGWVEHIHMEADGTLWFSGSEGLLRLGPRGADQTPPPLRTLLRGVRWGRGEGREGEPAGALQLPFRDNQVRFEFAMPSFVGEDGTRFEGMLEGHDREWMEWGPVAFREYLNLREGTYRFRVRGRDAHGTSGSEAQVTFSIRPPWYRTWPARLAALGALGVGVHLLVRWRLRALAQRNRQLEEGIRRRTEHLQKLNAMVEAINGSEGMDALLADILRETQVLRGADHTAALVREEGGWFRFRAWRGEGLEALAGVLLSGDEAEARYTHGGVEVSPDLFVHKDMRNRAAQAKFAWAPDMKVLVAVRIRVRDCTEGFFLFDSIRVSDAFDARELELLQGLRGHLVTALVKARTLDDLRRARDAAERAGTELRTANDHLYRLNDEKNRIISVAAHDLRNPLSGILLTCHVLSDRVPEEAHGDLRRIEGLGQGMNALIQELLDVNAIEADRAEAPDLAPISLGDLLVEAIRNHQGRAAAKSLELHLEPWKGCAVWADLRQAQRVLDNLLSNAIKYSPRERRIVVRALEDGDGVRVEIQDQGPGLTEEDKARVFGAYARLSARPTAGEPSVGLGLSIVKRLVEGMGGTLGVESEAGRGATFWFRLRRL